MKDLKESMKLVCPTPAGQWKLTPRKGKFPVLRALERTYKISQRRFRVKHLLGLHKRKDILRWYWSMFSSPRKEEYIFPCSIYFTGTVEGRNKVAF